MEQAANKFTESFEMYLETILILSRESDCVRQIDLARSLGVSRPSVHQAIRKLESDGYVLAADDANISLTAKGMALAENVYDRHRTFTNFLVHIGVDQKIAEVDACRIEHYVSEETFQAIKNFCAEEDCTGKRA
jgi:Mn-dependent DtxR family transcriptional regulator